MHRSLLLRAFALILTTASSSLADAQTPNYFGGYRCTERCQKHAQGFEWARDNRVREPAQCAGPTPSHIQGCMVYLQDRMRDPRKDDNGRLIE